jgi:hypothetical protein
VTMEPFRFSSRNNGWTQQKKLNIALQYTYL